jgi:hypothetical protein
MTDDVGQRLHCRRRFVQQLLLRGRQRDLDDLLHALGAELHRYADEQVVDPVLALQVDRAGVDLLLVLQDALDHLGRRRARRDPRARANQLGQLAAAAGGALRDRLDAIRGQHLGERHAADRRVARQRHHLVAVPAEHEHRDVLHRHLELLREKRAHAPRVEHAGHADDALARELAQAVDRLAHRVERVGHRDDDAVRRVADDLLGHRLHDLVVDVDEIVAAHARLARHARGDDDHVRPGAHRVVVAADDLAVRPDDGAALGDVQGDAGRLVLGDVDDDDVGEVALGDDARGGHADVAGAAYDCDFALHVCGSREVWAGALTCWR